MIVEMTHPNTRESLQINTDGLDLEKLKAINKPILSGDAIRKKIDGLNVSVEAKNFLHIVADVTIRVGNIIVAVGRKILEMILFFIKKYPNTAIGTIIGAIIGIIISAIPVIGWLLGWLIVPLCTALGMAMGFWKDIQNHQIGYSINSAIEDGFGTLKKIIL